MTSLLQLHQHAWLMGSVFFLFGITSGLANLPQWEPEDLEKLNRGEYELGKDLLMVKVVKKKKNEDDSSIEDPISSDVLNEEEIVNEVDALESLFLVRPVLMHPSEEKETPHYNTLQTISKNINLKYAENKATSTLFDPQGLLTNQEKNDLHFLLKNKMQETSIPLYIYIFDKHQKVRDNTMPSILFEKYYEREAKQGVGILIYYYLDNPGRLQVHIGGKKAEFIKHSELRELINAVKIQARTHSERKSQIEQAIQEIFVQLYWIEKNVMERDLSANMPMFTGAEMSKSLSKLEKLQQVLQKIASYWKIIVGTSTIFVLLLLVGVWRVKNRHYFFPTLLVEPSLDLPNGSHYSSILQYGEGSRPPIIQQQMEDDEYSI